MPPIIWTRISDSGRYLLIITLRKRRFNQFLQSQKRSAYFMFTSYCLGYLLIPLTLIFFTHIYLPLNCRNFVTAQSEGIVL